MSLKTFIIHSARHHLLAVLLTVFIPFAAAETGLPADAEPQPNFESTNIPFYVGRYPAAQLVKRAADAAIILPLALKRLGYDIVWVDVPENRSWEFLNSGAIDADFFRFKAGIPKDANLVPVPYGFEIQKYWTVVNIERDCGLESELPKKIPVGLVGVLYFNAIYERSAAGHAALTTVPVVLQTLSGRPNHYSVMVDSVLSSINAEVSGSAPHLQLKKCFETPALESESVVVLNGKFKAIADDLQRAIQAVKAELSQE